MFFKGSVSPFLQLVVVSVYQLEKCVCNWGGGGAVLLDGSRAN